MTTVVPSEPLFLSTLPGRYYYDPAIFELELEKIFSRMWVCVGRVDAVPNPGASRVVTLGNKSVVLIRSDDGTPKTLGPLPAALEIWEGFVYLNLLEHPAPVADQLHPVILQRFGTYEPFARYGIGDLKVGKSITYDVKANWKLLLENFMECYHCSPVHPEFCDLLPGFRSGKSYMGDDAATLADSVESFSMTGKASRPLLKGLRPEDARKYYGEVLLPNLLINLLSDHVVAHTVWPLAPDRSLVICDWLFDADVAASPEFDPMDAVEIFDIVNRQDWEVCEMTQLSMASRAFKQGGVYAPNERHIRAFADFVLARLDL